MLNHIKSRMLVHKVNHLWAALRVFANQCSGYTSPPIDLHAAFATHSEVSNVKAVVGTVNKKKAGIFFYTLNNIVKSRWQIQ